MSKLFLLLMSMIVSLYGQVTNRHNATCGTPLVQPITNILTGDVTPTPGSWPWMALVTEPNGHVYNSGVFIHPRVILSAAQHFASAGWAHIPRLQYWRVYSAVSNISMRFPTGSYHHVDKVLIHPGFNAATLENDVALVITQTPVVWTDKTRPVCMPDATHHYTEADTCFLPFWRAISKPGTEIALKQVALPILAPSVCMGFFSDMDPGQELCAGYHNRGKVTCWDDVGSPLLCRNSNGAWYIQGLSSWGGDCYNKTEPLVFKDVSKFTSWIQKTMAAEGFTIDTKHPSSVVGK